MTFDQSFSDFRYGLSTYATDKIDLLEYLYVAFPLENPYEINREFHGLKLRFESIV